MTRGYICVAQNNKDTNYVRLAYALALSLKNTQSKVSKLSIVTTNNVPKKYRAAFDKVIKIKNDRAKQVDWKLHNIVDLYEYSPYDETVILDSDMLFLTDVSHWWDKLSERDLWFTTNTKTHKDEETFKETIYRQEFIKNELPSIYMAFSYFKKSDKATELFDLTKLICENWGFFVKEYLSKQKPKVFSTDVAFALAIKLLQIENECTLPQLTFPYFTHMKPRNQNWNMDHYTVNEDWRKYTHVEFDKFNNSLGILIGCHRQFGPLHYHAKEFLTDEMISILESN